MIKKSPGRTPLYSSLDADFIERLKALPIANYEVCEFGNINEFCTHMDNLIQHSRPSLPPFAKVEANNDK